MCKALKIGALHSVNLVFELTSVGVKSGDYTTYPTIAKCVILTVVNTPAMLQKCKIKITNKCNRVTNVYTNVKRRSFYYIFNIHPPHYHHEIADKLLTL